MTSGPSREPSWYEGRQQILNAHPVPARRAQRDARDPIPVTARVHWSADGVETLPTYALACTTDLVLVMISDARLRIRGVWLPAGDVQRR